MLILKENVREYRLMKRFISTVMAACAVFVAAAYAMPAVPVSAISSSALSIVPKKNYVIEPGKAVTDKLTIRNLDTTNALVLTLRVVDFSFTDDGGTPKLFLDQNTPQTTWSLKPFLTVPKTVTVPKGSSKSLDMSVSIPKGHGAGSYYSAIIYSTGAPGTGGNVGLSASGVTLVFTQIPGKVKENLTLKNFGAYVLDAQTQRPDYVFFTMNKPQGMAYTLKNEGNVTEAPVGSITIKDMFGNEQKITNLNPVGSLALIGQTRTFTSCMKLESQAVDFNGDKSKANKCVDPDLWPGIYTATLDVFYGQNGNLTREVTGTAMFWYVPGWFIIALIAALLFAYIYGRKLWYKIQDKLHGGVRLNKSSRRRK